MLFAAGFGTRMKHLTRDRPKPMIDVGGRPLIDHALALTDDLPAEKTVANLHYKPEGLGDHLTRHGVETVLEMPTILDTGGGLRNALPLLRAHDVMTLNTDAIWQGPNPLNLLDSAWQPDHMDALLVCIPKERALGRSGPGSFIADATGRITRGDGAVYCGAQVIKTDILHTIPDHVFSLNLIWDLLIKRNSLFSVEYPGKWCDVGHPEGIALAERLLEVPDV